MLDETAEQINNRRLAAEFDAHENMAGELIERLIDILKVCPKPWQQMSENQQGEFLESLKAGVSHAVTRAVFSISSCGFPSLQAGVDKVVFKDGVQATLSIAPGVDGRHELADREGDVVVLVLASPEAFAGGMDEIEPEPDQKGLDLGHEYQENDGGGVQKDDRYDEALFTIKQAKRVSVSFIQRSLKIGYNRAARIVEEMERQGAISPPNSEGIRELTHGDS